MASCWLSHLAPLRVAIRPLHLASANKRWQLYSSAVSAAMIAVLLAPHPVSAQPRSRWLPMQGDLSLGTIWRDDGRPETPDTIGVGAAYLGYAMSLHPGSDTAFYGAGVEGTVNGSNGPYQWSIGAGTRMGFAFDLGRLRRLPDLYFYTRATPFFGMRSVADEEYLGEQPDVASPGAGLRLGIGFTASAWTAVSFPGAVVVGSAGAIGGGDQAWCCLGVLLLTLINHGELTYELYRETGGVVEGRIGFRLGTGF